MRHATILFALGLLLALPAAQAQTTDFVWIPSTTDGFGMNPLTNQPEPPAYFPGGHAGARSVFGPTDLDGDGMMEVILTDYSQGGRFHVLESKGVDTWELIYSALGADPTGTSANTRGVVGGDLDGDGLGEVIFCGAYGWAANNPILAQGLIADSSLIVLEMTGDDAFGLLPDTWEFDTANDRADRCIVEQFTIADLDGDGVNELLFGNNGSSGRYDNWFVLSASDLGAGFATWTQEARWSSRSSEDFDPVNRGGGSPYGSIPADLDGDGTMELALQTWNNLNFTNIDVTGPDTYVGPAAGDPNVYAHASPSDHVALFGCAAADLDMNGDDEVYCPNWYTGALTVLNYEAGENVLQVKYTSDSADPEYANNNIAYGIIEGASALGITVGDIDGDGMDELIGSGSSYTAGQYMAGNSPAWVRIVDYGPDAGDVEDGAAYSVRSVAFPEDMVDQFDTIHRDSLGVMSMYSDSGPAGPEFAGKLAFLGDVDGDGHAEVAMSFQGVADSLYVINEVWNPDPDGDPNTDDGTYERTVDASQTMPHPRRAFLRVMSGDGLGTYISNDRVILPTEYELHPNYPNPFNPSTTFSFTLPLDKRVSVRIYDVAGRLVRTLVNDEYYTEGTHQVTWDGRSDAGMQTSSGMYLYTLEWGQFRTARRMVMVK